MKHIFLCVFLTLFLSVDAQNLITPRYLKKGDTIAIVAPAGILKDKVETIDNAKKLAESWGLHVVLGKNLFNQNNHFAGTDNERSQDFQDALNNPNIKAIWSARGGYGSARIIDKLDFSSLKKNPKWVIGFSDITVFLNHLESLGVASIHGMMPITFKNATDESVTSLHSALFGKKIKYKIAPSSFNKEGKFKGTLVGGNLSILSSLLGSNSLTTTKDKIIFIEDIGERYYALDRYLQSLKRAGYFKNCGGLIVGDFSNIKKSTPNWGMSIEETILDALKEYDFPILFNFPTGHENDNRALYVGKKVKLKVSKTKTCKVVF